MTNGSDDRLQWCLETNGNYTMRNGYRLLLCEFPNTFTDVYNSIDQERKCLYNIL